MFKYFVVVVLFVVIDLWLAYHYTSRAGHAPKLQDPELPATADKGECRNADRAS